MTAPARLRLVPTPAEAVPTRDGWNAHAAARRLPPRGDTEHRGPFLWQRYPHETVALQARERAGYGEEFSPEQARDEIGRGR